MKTRAENPTGSYLIDLPTDIQKNYDGRVASYWKENESALLQISSYSRFEGEQVSANERMEERLKKEHLKKTQYETIEIPSCSDVVAFSGEDDEGIKWVYCYIVWSDLTILFSISGKPTEIKTKGKWAFDAIRSVRRTV